ncbi:hypothetical protein [Sulfobacillus sp. hq2]|uniref:hypothetical protein n=1 Tax=Sulfobacillus TaxID=28033 RepID=UPI000CD2FE7C|nr:hypothetical protein [Sulfobacillus sp. hq2]POB11426.1 hypothetical protein CO251_04595 [Sulfobacillus sp. hq2]
MAGILEPAMMWRGYNTMDPNNSYFTTTAGEATTLTFTAPVNRIVIYNEGTVPMNVKFGGQDASATNYDIVLPPHTGMTAGLNFMQVSVYSADAVNCYIGGIREDNTAI